MKGLTTMTLASRMPPVVSGEFHMLGPERRAAFGHWVRSVYAVVAHLDLCTHGCTAEVSRCPAGAEVKDDELAEWRSWRDVREAV
jgi:NAD-dependent dihydropyrimidine dehydrogenase PreA subunit